MKWPHPKGLTQVRTRSRVQRFKSSLQNGWHPHKFNSAADLAAYPRTENEDAAKLAPLGAHMLYVPDAAQIYPEGFASTVSVSGLSEGLCGAFRPGHFDGWRPWSPNSFCRPVPISPFFGEKDFQQLQLIRRMVK
ncbi:pantoate--beta-alanine ligase [Mesorhizobium sp. WSM2561]|uniref:pantoate--beta-alanine ligase n=1 Tax=Mesorhizobium sp. WSM2561 TaxID=1040985 RepID=UPI000A06FB6B|nr:pantoate--beta-alanine ligase [Mesorhizobium sp. WSM2561]